MKRKKLLSIVLAGIIAVSSVFSVNINAYAANNVSESQTEKTERRIVLSGEDKQLLETLFDAQYYASSYPDVTSRVGTSKAALFAHFCNYGLQEGRRVNRNFDVAAYASAYPDLEFAFGSDVLSYYKHYIRFGARENRVLTTAEDCIAAGITVYPVSSFSVGFRGVFLGSVNRIVLTNADRQLLEPMFDAEYYSANNPDVVAALGTSREALFMHFCNFGLQEGRRMNPTFDPNAYASAYADLSYAFGSDILSYYRHFVNLGASENRTLTTIESCNAAGITVYSVYAFQAGLSGAIPGSQPISVPYTDNGSSHRDSEMETIEEPDEEYSLIYIDETGARHELTWQDLLNNAEEAGEGYTLPYVRVENGRLVATGNLANAKLLIDASVTEIAEGAFADCEVGVVIITSEVTIAGGAFSNANIDKVLLREVGSVSAGAFSNATIEGLTFDCAGSVDTGAFENANIRNLSVQGELVIGERAFSNATIESFVADNCNVSIESYAFENTNIVNVVFERDSVSIAGYAFSGSVIDSMELGNGNSLEDYCFRDAIIDYLAVDSEISFTNAYCWPVRAIETLTMLSTVTEINAYQYTSARVKNVVIPETVESIGMAAFFNAKCENVVIDGPVAIIPDMCFGGCSYLTSVTLPASVQKIGGQAFGYRTNEVYHSLITEVIFEGTMEQWKQIKIDQRYEVTSHNGLENNRVFTLIPIYCCDGTIEPETFSGDGGGLDVDGDGTIDISWDELVENGNSSEDERLITDPYVKVEGKKLIRIMNMGDSDDTNLYLPNGLEEIGDPDRYVADTWGLLGYGTHLPEGKFKLHIPASVRVVNPWAFCYETGPDITFIFEERESGSELKICQEAFENEKLRPETFTFVDGLTEIGYYSFRDTIFETITLPDTLKTIEKCAFYECNELKEVFIPSSVTSMGETAFKFCYNLEGVYFEGTAAEFKALKGGRPLIYRYSADPPVYVNCSGIGDKHELYDPDAVEAAASYSMFDLPNMDTPEEALEAVSGNDVSGNDVSGNE